MSRGARLAAAVMILFAALAAAVALAVELSIRQAAREQAYANHQWCAALDLLTARPFTPAGPGRSRAELVQLYRDFVTVRIRFGCPPPARR